MQNINSSNFWKELREIGTYIVNVMSMEGTAKTHFIMNLLGDIRGSYYF